MISMTGQDVCMGSLQPKEEEEDDEKEKEKRNKERNKESNLVFHAQSTIAVISRRRRRA